MSGTVAGVTEALKILRSYGGRVPVGLNTNDDTEAREAFQRTWIDELIRYDDKALRMAAAKWVRNASTFPTVAEFIPTVAAIQNEIDRANTPALPGLESDKRVSPPDEARAKLAELRAQMAQAKGPLFRGEKGEQIDVV